MEEWLSAPAAYPAARPAIEALDPIAREELDRALEPIDLHAGETLFACGDPRDAAFLILRGRISLTGQGPQGGALPVRVLSPGEGVGEIGLAAAWAAHQHSAGPRRRQGLATGQDRLRGAVREAPGGHVQACRFHRPGCR